MEDIIAYSIIGILPFVVIYSAILLRRYFLRCKARRLKLQWEQAEAVAKQSREREQQHIKQQEELKSIAGSYSNGIVGQQHYDFHTNTIRTSVHDPKTNTTKYVTTPAAQIAPGTVLPQTANNFGTDLFTGMAIGGLVNSLFSTTAYSRPGTDDSDSQKSAYKSFSSSDSSSSWSDSSDSGPSSDW